MEISLLLAPGALEVPTLIISHLPQRGQKSALENAIERLLVSEVFSSL